MGRPSQPAAACLLALTLGSAIGAGGCQGSPVPSPVTAVASPRVEIADVQSVGPYRAADIRGVAGTLRFYFAPGGTCRDLVQEGAALLYLPEGRFGSLAETASAPRCSPVGVASLAAWRDQLPARRSRYLQPREPASLRPAGSGPGVILARGALPLAVELRIPGPGDLVAVLPDTPACRSLLAARSGMLEFRPEGPDPLVLEDRAGRCPIRGLARPLPLD